MANIFRAHRETVLARQAAEAEAGSMSPVSAEGKFARADGVGGIIRPDAATNEAAMMLVKLTTDRARLKQIQSEEGKVEAKGQMVPEYRDWLDKLIADPDQLETGVINDVLAMLTIWNIDVGDIGFALDLAGLMLTKDVPTPSWFKRTAGCMITEEIATAALKAAGAKEDFDESLLDRLQSLIEPEDERPVDMPDEVRAKLFKARAMLADNRLTILLDSGEAPDGPAGAIAGLIVNILDDARRALALHNGCGVKKLIEKIERLEKKIEGERLKIVPENER